MARGYIHQLINPRQREAVFGTRLVEFGEVDANSPFVTLLHQDRIGEPLWVMSLPNDWVGAIGQLSR